MTDQNSVPDMGPDTNPGCAPVGTENVACSPHLRRSEDGGGHTGQTPESAARNASQDDPAPAGVTAPAEAGADHDLTSPAGRPDNGSDVAAAGAALALVDARMRLEQLGELLAADAAPSKTHRMVGAACGDGLCGVCLAEGYAVEAAGAISAAGALLAEVREESAAWRDGYHETTRAIHGYRAAQKKAAEADFRSREAIRLAIEELDAGHPAGARATLANLIDGRPLAAVRDDKPDLTPYPQSIVIREDRPMASLDEIRARARGAAGPLQPGAKL